MITDILSKISENFQHWCFTEVVKAVRQIRFGYSGSDKNLEKIKIFSFLLPYDIAIRRAVEFKEWIEALTSLNFIANIKRYGKYNKKVISNTFI